MRHLIVFIFLSIYCFWNVDACAQNPTIVSISPQPSANNIALNTNISITFDLSIDAASLNGSSIIVRGSQTGVIPGVLTGGGSSVITFNPDNSYKSGEVVSITITAALLSQSGFNLLRGHTYSFTAISGISPTSPPTFAQRRVNFTSGSSPTHDISALDFDKDGDLDLIVGVEVPQGLTELWENDGSQGFCKRDIGNYENVEVHDIDGDGDLDSFGPGGNGVSLNWYRNEGDGGPFTQVLIAGTNVMWAATGGDLDSDGDIDAVAMTLNGNGTSSPKWFANNGAGVFTLNGIAATVTSGVETETYLYLADINADGAMDILTYRDNTDNIAWYENNGSQVFTERIIISDSENLRLSAADVDGDGDTDILSASNTSTVTLSWYENDGSENFTLHSVPVTSPNRLFTVEGTDVDGDLDMDLVAGGYWFENDGTENFTQRTVTAGLGFVSGGSALSFGVNHADLDSDGDMDLLTLGYLGNGFRWQENVRFMNVTANTPANAVSGVTANSDITITFDQPIANASVTANSFRVISNLRGSINGSFSGGGTNAITFNPANDFLPGEEIEVAINEKVVSLSGHRLEITHGFDFKVRIPVVASSPAFTASSIMTHTTAALWMDVADMDADGDVDVVSCTSSRFFWHRNDGIGNFASVQITTSASPRRIFATDYNNDGNMDVIMQTTGITLLYVNDGNENFSESPLTSLSGTIYEFADVNRDGDADAVAGIRWLDRNCDVYSIAALPTLAGTASATTAADLDNDGDIDLFRSVTSGSSFLLNDGYINYNNTAMGAGLSYTDLADLDGDGDLDILGVQPSAAIVWYRNQLNEVSANFGVGQNLPLVSDGPILINSADLNGDGKMDIVVMSDVDNELNWFANNASVSPTLPTITSFSPTFGAVGATVTITGTNFSTTPANNNVQFNGTTGVVSASTATSITTTVPTGATTGKITVTVAGNTATSAANFTVTVPLPTITSFAPASGPVGTSVTITGTNFSTTPGNNIVKFNGTTAVASASTTTSITTIVPAGASTGTISVTVGTNMATSATNFTVTTGAAITFTTQPTDRTQCAGISTTFSVVATGDTNLQYQWQIDNAGFADLTNSTLYSGVNTATFAITNPTTALNGKVYRCVVHGDNSTDTPSASAMLTVNSVPTTPTIGTSDLGCAPASTTLTPAGSAVNESYHYYEAPTAVNSAGSGISFTTPSLSVSTTYYISTYNTTTLCESTRTPALVTVQTCNAPVVIPTTSAAYLGGIVTIDLTPLISDPDDNLDIGTLKIASQPTSGATATLHELILTVDYTSLPFPGTDALTIEICDLTEICTQQKLTIETVGDISVYNAVSPNDDGKNDTFILQYVDMFTDTQKNKVTIFNRWGDAISEIENYNNKERVFKGLNKSGNEVPSGTYFYKIEYTSGRAPKMGYLVLKR